MADRVLPAGAVKVPIRLGVTCDRCDQVFEGDFMGHSLMPRAERLSMILDHVQQQLGWAVASAGETYCKRCETIRRLGAAMRDRGAA